MADNARFHNKYHRKNHHTLPSPGYPDSGSDPIASLNEPFQGGFHVQGGLSATGDLFIGSNAIVLGSLSAFGDTSIIDTFVTVTSSMSVVNAGTGPAFTVKQTGAQDIAIFMDDTRNALKIMDGLKIRFYDESNPGAIGINTNDMANALTVKGTVSASGNLVVNGSTTLGDTNTDTTVIRGTVRIADSDTDAIEFGSNNASYDTNLYRSSSNLLKTDDSFEVGNNGGKTTLNLSNTTADVGLTIGGDTNLYRNAADLLKTDDSLIVTNNLGVSGNTTLGEANTDTTIIRGTVKIADSDSDAIVFGSADANYDTNLYRSVANTLRTDDNLIVNLDLNVNGNTTLGDTNADTLTIQGTNVSIPNNLNIDTNTLFINSTNDRVGIGTITPNEKLTVVGNISGSQSVVGVSLCGRYVDVSHTPANDGTNPYIRIGETSADVVPFSGYVLEYEETANNLNLSSIGFFSSKQAVRITPSGDTRINLLSATTPNYTALDTAAFGAGAKPPLTGSALATDFFAHQIRGRVGVNTYPVSSYNLHVRGGNIRVDGVDYSSVPGFNGTTFDSDGQSLFDLRSASPSANYSLSIASSGLGHFIKLFGGRDRRGPLETANDAFPFIGYQGNDHLRIARTPDFFFAGGFIEVGRFDSAGNFGVGPFYTSTTLPERITVWGSVSAASLSAVGSRFNYIESNLGIGEFRPAEKLTVSGNISALGSIRASSLSARSLDAFHTPANDGVDPTIRIGEFDLGTGNNGFSGMLISYSETSNTLGLSSLFAPAMGTRALTLDRNNNFTITNQVSVGGSIINDQFEFVRGLPAESSVYSVVSTGVWASNGFNIGVAVTCPSQDCFLTPIWIPTDCFVLSAAVITDINAASVDLRVCIYDATIDGRPNSLVGNIISMPTGITTGGELIVGNAFGFPIRRGNYYAGVMAKGASASLLQTYTGNISKQSGQISFTGINRLLPTVRDQEGGNMITAMTAGTDPAASLISRTIDFTSTGGTGVISRVKFRQSAPFVQFRISNSP